MWKGTPGWRTGSPHFPAAVIGRIEIKHKENRGRKLAGGGATPAWGLVVQAKLSPGERSEARIAKARFKIQNSRNVPTARPDAKASHALAASWPGRPCHRERSAGPALRPCGTSGLRRALARRTGKFRWAKAGPRRKGPMEKPQGWRASLALRSAALRFAGWPTPPAHTFPQRLSAESRLKMRGAECCSALQRRLPNPKGSERREPGSSPAPQGFFQPSTQL